MGCRQYCLFVLNMLVVPLKGGKSVRCWSLHVPGYQGKCCMSFSDYNWLLFVSVCMLCVFLPRWLRPAFFPYPFVCEHVANESILRMPWKLYRPTYTPWIGLPRGNGLRTIGYDMYTMLCSITVLMVSDRNMVESSHF